MKKSTKFLLMLFFIFVSENIFAETERFVEENGRIVIEAENYHRHSRMGVFRHWYTLPDVNRTPEPNSDPFHSGASGGKYLKALPFTRVTPQDTLIDNLNFFETGNEAPRLEYDVLINDPGRYYVWVRAYPTGSENNSIHVGYNDIWPENGKAVQWCGSSGWTWSSHRKLDAVPCGYRNGAYLDLPSGPLTIIFSMREDGFEFDKFILVKDTEYTPTGSGPDESSSTNRCHDGIDNNGNGLIDCEDPACLIYNSCRLPLKGRIAISSDGNGGDPDDIGASATMLAILSSQNLKHKLVHKDYGNDMKGNYDPVWIEMQKTITEGIELFSFNPDVFFNDQIEFNAAVDNLRKEINKSTMSDPLTIIHAGVLSVISEAILQSEPEKRKYVTVISHSWWNDYSHSFDYNDFYYADVVGPVKDDLVATGISWIQIMDQNTYLHTKRDETPWQFLRDSEDAKLNWIFERIVTARDIRYNKYDISDAGMLYFAITGDEEVTPQKLKEMLIPPPSPSEERGMTAYWSFNHADGNVSSDGSAYGNDLYLKNASELAAGKYGQGLYLPDNSQSYAGRENDLLSNNFPAVFPGMLGDELSLSAWIKINELDSGDRSPVINKESQGKRGFSLDVRNPGYLHFQIAKDNNTVTKTGDYPGERTLILPDTWYHVAASYQYITDGSSVIKLYVNGEAELIVNTATGPVMNNNSPLEIGAYRFADTYHRYFMGIIDEVYVFNKVLTPEEISELMDSEVPPSIVKSSGNNVSYLSCYPNPSKTEFIVEFEVFVCGLTELMIYDLQGRKIKTLLSEVLTPGMYKKHFDSRSLSAGLYILRFVSGKNFISNSLVVS